MWYHWKFSTPSNSVEHFYRAIAVSDSISWYLKTCTKKICACLRCVQWSTQPRVVDHGVGVTPVAYTWPKLICWKIIGKSCSWLGDNVSLSPPTPTPTLSAGRIGAALLGPISWYMIVDWSSFLSVIYVPSYSTRCTVGIIVVALSTQLSENFPWDVPKLKDRGEFQRKFPTDAVRHVWHCGWKLHCHSTVYLWICINVCTVFSISVCGSKFKKFGAYSVEELSKTLGLVAENW